MRISSSLTPVSPQFRGTFMFKYHNEVASKQFYPFEAALPLALPHSLITNPDTLTASYTDNGSLKGRILAIPPEHYKNLASLAENHGIPFLYDRRHPNESNNIKAGLEQMAKQFIHSPFKAANWFEQSHNATSTSVAKNTNTPNPAMIKASKK